jgi:hypothetical protein
MAVDLLSGMCGPPHGRGRLERAGGAEDVLFWHLLTRGGTDPIVLHD